MDREVGFAPGPDGVLSSGLRKCKGMYFLLPVFARENSEMKYGARALLLPAGLHRSGMDATQADVVVLECTRTNRSEQPQLHSHSTRPVFASGCGPISAQPPESQRAQRKRDGRGLARVSTSEAEFFPARAKAATFG